MASKPDHSGKTRARQRSRREEGGLCGEDRPILEPNAAGTDIGAREIFVAVPPDCDPDPVRVFDSFTEDLQQLADWLIAGGITTVPMESTGVYGYRCTAFCNRVE